MKRIIFTLICLFTAHAAFTQHNDGRERTFHLSFAPPLSSNGSHAGQYTNRISLNLLVGVSRNETGFTLGGLTNIIHNDARGFQMAGINNLVGNDGSGFLMSGIANTVMGSYRGFQLTGVANVTKGSFSGLQLAGVGNVAGDVTGMQLGGVFNVARDVNGFQFGALNVGRNVRGLQFGVVNVARDNDYPLGIVNIVRNGEKSVGVSYNETGSALLSFRSGGRVLYGILGVGYNHKAGDEKYVLEAGLGAHINIVDRFRINNEIKSLYMTSFDGSQVNHYSFAILPAFRPIGGWEVFAGPSINFMHGDNEGNGKLFPNHSLWKKYGDKKSKQLFAGFVVGTQFCF